MPCGRKGDETICVSVGLTIAAARRHAKTTSVQVLLLTPRGEGAPCERTDRNNLHAIPRQVRTGVRRRAYQAAAGGPDLLNAAQVVGAKYPQPAGVHRHGHLRRFFSWKAR